MASPSSLPVLLDSLTQSLSSAIESTPRAVTTDPIDNGISLLDVKNELLLSYLQNLVFLILLKIRNAKKAPAPNNTEDEIKIADSAVHKLVELRLYMEKGVRPLEEKLRYQIDKILRAADDAERSAKSQNLSTKTNGSGIGASSSESESGSDSGSDEDDDEVEDSGEEENGGVQVTSYQARPDAFVRPSATSTSDATAEKNGVYRPPRIAPTVMPTDRREKNERRAHKSATMDEFIENELSTAPLAEPSIGTNVVSGGRKVKTAADRKDEEERREYEESNFVRLPKASKKDKTQRVQQAGRNGRMQFGGEEWRDLGEGADRINRLTAQTERSKGTKALLEKSRKRGRDTTDGPRGTGHGPEMGERYQKRLKVVEAGRRDRGSRK